MRQSQKKKLQMKHDAILATINSPTAYQASQNVIPSSDSALKVYAGRLDAMPDRKLTFERKSNPQYKEANKHYKSFSNS